MTELLRILASLALGFVFTTVGGLEIVLEREVLARRFGAWACDVPRYGLKLAGLAAVLAGLVIVLPGLVAVPPVLVPGAGAVMILLTGATALLHWRRREPARLAANVAVALLAGAVTGGFPI